MASPIHMRTMRAAPACRRMHGSRPSCVLPVATFPAVGAPLRIQAAPAQRHASLHMPPMLPLHARRQLQEGQHIIPSQVLAAASACLLLLNPSNPAQAASEAYTGAAAAAAEAQQLQGSLAQPPRVSAPVPAPSPAFCDPAILSTSLERFRSSPTGDGFDGGGSVGGLLAFYKRLGCTEEQLLTALTALDGPPSPALAVGLPSPAPSTPPGIAGDAGSRADGYASSGLPGALAAVGQPQPQWVYGAELAVAAVAAAAIWAWQARPLGWVARELVEVRASDIAGRGLFAKVDIPKGAVVGAYPGRLRSGAEMAAKAQYAPMCAQYVFQTSDGRYLDPTDETGLPSVWPAPGPPWPFPCEIALSYANEPPKGSGGTSCFVEDGEHSSELLFVANRGIQAGEEILIDYGRTYDRSGYTRS